MYLTAADPVSLFFIHLFIHLWLYSPLLGHGLFFRFVIFSTQTVGLLGRALSPSQGRYLHTGQHKHRINAQTDIHALSGIRTHDPSFRASEDSSCLRMRGHCDRSCFAVETYKYIFSFTFHTQVLWQRTEKFQNFSCTSS
jgi:hypothetical protein